MSVYVVAGAGTDIGKTFITALLVRRLRAAGRAVLALKPVASGVPDPGDAAFAATDTARLLAAQGLALTPASLAACSPWRFAAPLSPDMAAAAEGQTVTLEAVADFCRARIAAADPDGVVLVEGAGGVMSPIASDALNLDLIKALACPVVLVAGSYLGAISHALTAIEALAARGASVRALVVNESAGSEVDFDATLETLRRHAGATVIVPVRRNAETVALDLA